MNRSAIQLSKKSITESCYENQDIKVLETLGYAEHICNYVVILDSWFYGKVSQLWEYEEYEPKPRGDRFESEGFWTPLNQVFGSIVAFQWIAWVMCFDRTHPFACPCFAPEKIPPKLRISDHQNQEFEPPKSVVFPIVFAHD